MNNLFLRIKRLALHRAIRWLAIPMLILSGIGVVVGQVAPPPLVSLASEPLYARGVRSKPTLTLALSVEFPTVGQAYQASAAYDPTSEYVGYFDPTGCYTYVDANKRFERNSTAAAHVCGGTLGFSGNFMNWASTSAIDILRYGLTGGDRITDTTTDTVLQRAVIPSSFYNSSNFPSRSITNAIAVGALPSAVLGSTSGSVVVANCLNRIFFGTATGGDCNNPGTNGNLGIATPAAVTSASGYTQCASENGTCTFTGTRQVIYGANSSYATKYATTSIDCNNNVFGDPLNGTAKKCYYGSTATVPTNTTADAFFTTRVSVCNSSSGVLSDARPSLCIRYPSGNFKPVGNLQKYSDRMRVAAFGYLHDDNQTRYGGVLRAPMKYVGQNAYDDNFNLISGTNSAQEWNESTGVFYENPSSSTEFAVSGVTNYLNRFGRTSSTPGVYKTYDPVNELYYEALRYIQGLSPTPDAVSGLVSGSSDPLKDGYPVYSSWTDPHPAISGLGSTGDYSCVKNNILTIGDVNTHYDKQIPGNTVADTYDAARAANVGGNEPDFKSWTQVVGGFESATATAYVDGNGVSQNTSNPNPGNTSRSGMQNQIIADNSDYFMSGMAYWSNTHDIRGTAWTDSSKRRPGMRAKTYIIDVNEYGAQNVTATRQNNQFYLAAKYGGFNDQSGKGNPFLKADGTTDNSIWQQGNGDAKTYFLAGAPTALLAALDNIFAQIASEANSIAGGSITTQTLTSAGGNIYEASFDPTDWSGNVTSYTVALNSDGTVALGTSGTSPWKAGDLLDARTAARNIVVGKLVPDSTSAATAFTWNAISTAHQNALRLPPGGTAGTTTLDYATEADVAAAPASAASAPSGEGRLNFIRGTRTKESSSGPYRKRGSVLGDIVNSGAVYKGAPSSSISDSGYRDFYQTNLNRTKAVYVGANDGMLHAFDAANGAELFAYIPSFLVAKLPDLTSTSYVHKSYVDATPTVSEANLGSATSPNWKTVLLSGVGGGGQGVFALDVSTPSSFTSNSVLWEFTDHDDADLGNVIGKPKILKVRVSGPTASTPTYKWFAVFGSGVNNYASDGYVSSTNKPAIFFLDLSKPTGTSWARGNNYFKISFPQASSTAATGLVGFSTIVGSTNELSTIYSGDLQGNLWKLNFTNTSAANATNVNVASLLVGSAVDLNASNPLYIAKDGTTATKTQPITMEPSLIYGPNGSIVVVFGTGKFIESSDNSGPYNQQSVYALMDGGTAAISSRGYLSSVSQDSSTGALTGTGFTWGMPTSASDATVRAGWFFDFANSATSGERQISNMTLVGANVVFGSLIPAQNGCDKGSGRLYIISQAGGVGTSILSTVGILGQPFVVQLGNTTVSTSDSTGRRSGSISTQTILQGSDGLTTAGSSSTSTVPLGRLSWRQLNNFQEIKNSTN